MMAATKEELAARDRMLLSSATEVQVVIPLSGQGRDTVLTVSDGARLCAKCWGRPIRAAAPMMTARCGRCGALFAYPLLAPADATALEQPIEIAVDLKIPSAAEDALLDHLNALHGRPDGVPLDEEPPAALVEAHCTVRRERKARLRVTHVDASGRMTVELAEPSPAEPSERLVLKGVRAFTAGCAGRQMVSTIKLELADGSTATFPPSAATSGLSDRDPRARSSVSELAHEIVEVAQRLLDAPGWDDAENLLHLIRGNAQAIGLAAVSALPEGRREAKEIG